MDVAILSGEQPDLRSSSLADRRRRLRGYGLLESTRSGMRTEHASPLQAAAASLLQARPHIAQDLPTAAALDVLLSIHALTQRHIPATKMRSQWLSGRSTDTHRRALQHLHKRNLVLIQKTLRIAPSLRPLHAFLTALEAQASIPRSAGTATVLHHAALEAAWHTQRPSDLGQEVCTGTAYDALHVPGHIHYRGPRHLDDLDEAFLFLLSDSRFQGDERFPSARSAAFIISGLTMELAKSHAFQDRAHFYGFRGFPARALDELEHGYDPTTASLIEEFGVSEGWLAV